MPYTNMYHAVMLCIKVSLNFNSMYSIYLQLQHKGYLFKSCKQVKKLAQNCAKLTLSLQNFHMPNWQHDIYGIDN